jgi:hypothetical protein
MMAICNAPKLEIVEYPNSVMADLIKDTESLLTHIKEYNNIISEYKFKNIKIYGDNNNPCFQANCIFDYLYPKYMKNFHDLSDDIKRIKSTRKRKFTRWINDNFEYEISNNTTDEIYKAQIKNNLSDKRYYECYVLTEAGMLTAMCSNKTELSRIFKRRILQFIKNIRAHYILIYNKERINSNNSLRKELEFEKNTRRELQIINNSNIQLQEAFHNPNSFGTCERTELAILRRETQKQYYLYVVDWAYVNSKFWSNSQLKKDVDKKRQSNQKKLQNYFNESSDSDEMHTPVIKKQNKKIVLDNTIPHINGIAEEYNLYYINQHELNNNNTYDYYFCIKPKKIIGKRSQFFKFIEYISIKNTDHYKAMIQIINNGNKYNYSTSYPINSSANSNANYDIIHGNYESDKLTDNSEISTPYNDIFIKSYSDIHDARNSSFINLNKSTLIIN